MSQRSRRRAESLQKKQQQGAVPPTTPQHATVTQSQRQFMVRTGPIPDPDTIKQYEAIHPGAAGILFNQFEKQGDHRRSLEDRMVGGNQQRQTRGQWMAFVLSMTAIVGGVALIWNGRSTEGLTSIIGALVALVAVFIIGKVSEAKQRDSQQE